MLGLSFLILLSAPLCLYRCMNQLMAIGLAADIAGVIFLGAALMATNDSRLKAQAGTYFNFSTAVLKALVAQRTDARIGLPLLVLGFVLQLLGVLDLSIDDYLLSAAWVVLATLIIGCVIARHHVSQARLAVLTGELNNEDEKA
ncbi:MAG: hypothetical protein HQ514_15985 [Rhodospirillales bacterium]|nr:hypothetical protein [Rhodospirillales bacterium]